MNVILGALVRRIKQRAYLDTDEEIARWIEEYCEQSKSHIAVVGRPASASVSEGEQLGNEAGATNAARGHCDNFYHNFDVEDFGECTECKGKDVRKSSEGHL